MKKTTIAKPFGLELLTEVDLLSINGGRHKHHRHHHHPTPPPPSGGGTGGGGVHTMAVSMPQPAFPHGDSF